jgi:hypothetical protein
MQVYYGLLFLCGHAGNWMSRTFHQKSFTFLYVAKVPIWECQKWVMITCSGFWILLFYIFVQLQLNTLNRTQNPFGRCFTEYYSNELNIVTQYLTNYGLVIISLKHLKQKPGNILILSNVCKVNYFDNFSKGIRYYRSIGISMIWKLCRIMSLALFCIRLYDLHTCLYCF